MAIIKYSGLVDQLRGKLNGTVFSRFHSGFNAYKKGQPSAWGSSYQMARRAGLSLAAQVWGTLEPYQRGYWALIASNTPETNRIGDTVHLSGFNYFVRYFLYNTYAGEDPVLVPETSLDAAYGSEYDLVSISATRNESGNLVLSVSGNGTILTTSGDENIFFLYITAPKAIPDGVFNGTPYLVYTELVPSGLPAPNTFPFAVNDLIAPLGLTTWDGAYHEVQTFFINRQSAQRSPVWRSVAQASYTPPAPPVWPLSWAYPNNDARYTELQNAGGTWQPQGSGIWIASPGELLPGVAADYEFELAMSPNLFTSDIARPEEFDVPRPTLSGNLAAKSDSAPYYITPATISDLQSWMRSNFSYTGADEYKYQPTAIRIKNPTTGAWSNWGYSNIWLPIF